MENYRILIVGGSRGLGKGLTEEFSKYGGSVSITVRSEVSHSSDERGSVAKFRLDLNDPTQGEQLSKALSEGSHDVIVLNAGIFGPDHQRAELASGPDVEALFMTNAVS